MAGRLSDGIQKVVSDIYNGAKKAISTIYNGAKTVTKAIVNTVKKAADFVNRKSFAGSQSRKNVVQFNYQ